MVFCLVVIKEDLYIMDFNVVVKVIYLWIMNIIIFKKFKLIFCVKVIK